MSPSDLRMMVKPCRQAGAPRGKCNCVLVIHEPAGRLCYAESTHNREFAGMLATVACGSWKIRQQRSVQGPRNCIWPVELNYMRSNNSVFLLYKCPMLNVTCPVCLAMLLKVASQLLSHVNYLCALCAVLLSATAFPSLFSPLALSWMKWTLKQPARRNMLQHYTDSVQ